MIREKNITDRLEKLNKRLKNQNNEITTNIVKRIKTEIEKYGEVLVFNFSNMNIAANPIVEKVKTHYANQEIFITPTEEKFINYIITHITIDLSEHEKEKMVEGIIEKIILPLHTKYLEETIYRLQNIFSLTLWQQQAQNKNFLEYLSTIYFDTNELPTYIYGHHGEMLNYLESLTLAKDKIDTLKPIYDKIIDQIFTYTKASDNAAHSGEYIAYPLNIIYGQKDFLSDYIMKTPKEKLHPKAKESIFKRNIYNTFSLAILASSSFTPEEKDSIIEKLNQYEKIPKNNRKYYQHTYQEILNKVYFYATWDLINNTKEEYKAIDTKKLYELESNEQRTLLEQIIDTSKMKYYKNFYSSYIYIHDGISQEELKKHYIDDFIQLTQFLKQEEKLHSFQLTRTGVIRKTEDNFLNRQFEEHEQEENVVTIEKQTEKTKKKKFLLPHHPRNRLS